jgi:hypothetical protein
MNEDHDNRFKITKCVMKFRIRSFEIRLDLAAGLRTLLRPAVLLADGGRLYYRTYVEETCTLPVRGVGIGGNFFAVMVL